ncbi:cytochrome c biogenesis CcdA family protein [Pseudothermotoga thermarum]|uniref:Cytochrome c biogenesis protein transmembrane region n=1 Tax=Pseudothermotoga thermarum DSM 5069 TaxID=688269 RepID=F7YVN6_9THEM|nr:cytochrome c biogenesis CcdA family protein [Pseudothermotoga thermarum]AEH51701.1 cytochrome c biogenesis protein transmembrane region [Pseudothermotoga thermarum DSM 5069]
MELAFVNVDFFTALAHGLLAFFSPCVIPLVPSFVALVLSEKGTKSFFRILGFFMGLSGTFSVLGAIGGSFGMLFDRTITRYIAGSLILAMGIVFLLQLQLFKVKVFNLYKFKSGGFLSGLIVGVGIGLIWIPCTSPILASILILASTKGTALKGAWLLFVYSMGISIPFLTVGGLVSRWFSKVTFGKPLWEKIVKIAAFLLLSTVGLLILFGIYL